MRVSHTVTECNSFHIYCITILCILSGILHNISPLLLIFTKSCLNFITTQKKRLRVH